MSATAGLAISCLASEGDAVDGSTIASLNSPLSNSLGQIGLVARFLAQSPDADLAEPFGVWDLGDLQAFVAAFTAGCP